LLNGANGLYDGSYHVTGVVQSDKWFELTDSTSTAPPVPKAGHAKIYLNKTTRQICTEFDDGSVSCPSTSGTIAQVIVSSNSNSLTTNSACNSYVNTPLSVNITPKNTTDIIVINSCFEVYSTAGGLGCRFKHAGTGLSNNNILEYTAPVASYREPLCLVDSFSPGSISPQIYTLQICTNNGTCVFNDDPSFVSQMVIEENIK
jgi:hypothetical protein